MIFASLLLAASLFAVILTLGRILGPEGDIGKKLEIRKRIAEGTGSHPFLNFTSLLRQDHLSDIHQVQQVLEKQSFAPYLALLLKRSGSNLSVSTFLLMHLFIAMTVFMIAKSWMPLMPAFLLSGICLYLPFFILKRKNSAYLEKFSDHLPDAISIISNNLKVGQSIENALAAVTRSVPHPVSTEFQSISGEMKLGLPLDQALRNLYERIKTSELKIFVTGINIQQELGGNLSEIMENLGKTIRERFALDREIKVLSAQGVLSMWVLLCLPFAVSSIWLVGERQLLMDYVTSGFGQKMIMLSFMLQASAFFIMKKIVKIKD